MVRLGVADDQVVDLARIDQLLQLGQPLVAELLVTGVDQGGLLAPDQKGVVGGAVLEAELDIEPAAVPVEGADGPGFRADFGNLQGETGDGGNHGRASGRISYNPAVLPQGLPVDPQLFLAIGNSRLHWALWRNGQVERRWDSPHFDRALTGPELEMWLRRSPLAVGSPLTVASVVPAQTACLPRAADIRILDLADVPLQDLYPTLGLDRALALLGAGQHYGWPVLVIDGGTALTLTAAQEPRCLQGGAILPGLALQARSLGQGTAALPEVTACELPPRWARQTEAAIAGGLLYGLRATLRDYLQDWWAQCPGAAVVLTGGDGPLLRSLLTDLPLSLDPDLLFRGMAAVLASPVDPSG